MNDLPNTCDNCGTVTGYLYWSVYCDDCRPLFIYPDEIEYLSPSLSDPSDKV